MTEEERDNAQEQLKALSQAYSELSQHCSDQTTSAEEVGHLTVSSIEWFAFCVLYCVRKQCHLLVSCMTNRFPPLPCTV